MSTTHWTLVTALLLLGRSPLARTTIGDTLPPSITACAPNMTLDANAACSATMPDLTALVEAVDDSGAFTVSQSPLAGTLHGPGVVSVVFTVTDAAGNFATCSATVTILDSVAPTITVCASNVTIVAGTGCLASVPDLRGSVTATDACGGTTIAQVPAAGTSVGLGLQLVTLTVTDAHGNTAECTAEVTVASSDADGDGILNCADECPNGPSTVGVVLNEIYVNPKDVDTLEFLELKGPAGASLACHMLLVVDGDGSNAGTLDKAWDLGAFSIASSGFFVLGDSAVVGEHIDLGAHDGLENGTCTFYLVTTSQQTLVSGLVGSRIDQGVGVTSIPMLCDIIDAVALFDSVRPTVSALATDAVFDAAFALGPDGVCLPAGVFRCGNEPHDWSTGFLEYDPSASMPLRTPGAANATACAAGTAFCAGDGSSTPCPCGNSSQLGAGLGCLNSLGTGGKLRGEGAASLSADAFVLEGSGMTNAFVLYFQGTLQVNGGNGAVFGDGLRCAGGAVLRLGTVLNSGGASSYPNESEPSISVRGAISSPGVRTYQGWYRNNDAAFCTSDVFNLTNGLSVVWAP